MQLLVQLLVHAIFALQVLDHALGCIRLRPDPNPAIGSPIRYTNVYCGS
jgi:hypothetical protein